MLGSTHHSPIGPIELISNGRALAQVRLPGSFHPPVGVRPGNDAVLELAKNELTQYFEGSLREFTVPVALDGTSFQQAAWTALQDIPYGETRSYGEQAAAIGKPGAARAIGQANRSNKLPIIVPCHRVLAADGGIGGYMGLDGGETVKVDLLRLEGAWVG